MNFEIGSVVRKNSRKPFQNGSKTAVITGFDVMKIPSIGKGNTPAVEAVSLQGCEGLVRLSILRLATDTENVVNEDIEQMIPSETTTNQIYIFFKGAYQDGLAFDGNVVVGYIGKVSDDTKIQELAAYIKDLTEKTTAADNRKVATLSIVNMIRLPF